MQNNDFLRRFRYAVNLKNEVMLALFEKAKHPLEEARLLSFFKKEDEPGFEALSDELLSNFLDAYITLKRGESDKPMSRFNPLKDRLNNNLLLKKIRIALMLDEKAMLEVFKRGGVSLSTSELSALFRKPGNRHYRACGDQWMRPFLAGLSAKSKS